MSIDERNNMPALRFSGFSKAWKLVSIEQVSKIVTSGSRDWAQYYSSSGAKFIRMTNLDRNGIQLLLDDLKYVSLPSHGSEGERASLQPKDILISITAELGKIGLVPDNIGEAYINQHTALVRPNREIVNSFFLAFKLYSSDSNKRLNRLNDSGAKAGLNLGTIRRVLFNLPEVTEQKRIAAFLGSVDDKLNKLRRKRELLETYKHGLMQKIFSQQLRFTQDDGSAFPDWEKEKLSNLTFKTGKKNKENIKHPIYSINNKQGFIPQSDQFKGMDSNDRGHDITIYKIIKKNVFSYNPARINVGSIGFSGDLEYIIISSLYVCFKTNEELEDNYLLHFINTYNFNKSVLRNVEGGVRNYFL